MPFCVGLPGQGVNQSRMLVSPMCINQQIFNEGPLVLSMVSGAMRYINIHYGSINKKANINV